MTYRAPEVIAVQQFFADLYPVYHGQSISAHLKQVADRMLAGLLRRETASFVIASNWHPEYVGMSQQELTKVNWNRYDARISIAREHGFATWENLLDAGVYDGHFEQFIALLLTGELATLKSKLKKYPYLINARSNYGHHATPLHYLMANGTETRRQQVPAGLPEIVAFLLAAGAEKDATMYVYGQDCSPLALLTSSAHPYAAGVGRATEKLLRD